MANKIHMGFWWDRYNNRKLTDTYSTPIVKLFRRQYNLTWIMFWQMLIRTKSNIYFDYEFTKLLGKCKAVKK